MTPPFTRFETAFLAVLTAALSAGICVAARQLNLPAIVFLAVMNAAALATGRLALPARLTAFRSCGAYVTGVLLLSLAVLFLCLVFTLSAGPVAIATAAVTVPLAWRQKPRAANTGWPDLFIAIIAGAATLIWSWQAITTMPRLATTGLFHAWTDDYLHAGEIAQFAALRALHGGTIFAAGAPLPPYHYASYILPAALTGLTGLPALTTATALWTPLSLLLLGLAAAFLGGALAGTSAGLLALTAVLLAPSASHYGLKNPFFDVHWLLQVSSSSGFALACGCISLACLVLWLRESQPSALAAAAGLALAALAFRVQIFVALAPTAALVFLAAWRPSQPWRRTALAAGAAAAALAAMLALEHVQRAPHFFTGPHHPIRLLLTMHAMTPSAYAGFYKHAAFAGTATLWHRSLILALGVLLLLAAAFGLWLPLYAATLLRRPRAPDQFIPLAALAAYLAILIFFPFNPLEKLEFAHRPYILVYTLLAIWSAAFAARWIKPRAAAAICTAALITPLTLSPAAQCSNLDWGFYVCGVPVPRGLIDTAAYLRTHTPPGAVIALPPSPLDEAFLALAQRPEFSPGTAFSAIQSGLPPAALAQRQTAQAAFAATSRPTRPRIAWRVTFPPAAPKNPAFAESGFAAQKLP